MTLAHSSPCTACGGTHILAVASLRGIPVLCNVLWPTRREALAAPRGDMELRFCCDCGHVFNAAFRAADMEYTQAYENSLHFSPEFRRFAEQLADRLISRYDLHGKDIIDLGCGKGDFLRLICERGGNRGTGFDPSYVPDHADADPSSPVRFVREFYSERHTAYPVDLIACRHVLEHIPDPRAFLANLRRSVGDRLGTAVYFEVPNVRYTMRDMGVWDLIYEHPSYFSAGSLGLLFARGGFSVRSLEETFGGQYLSLEAHPAEQPDARRSGDSPDDLRPLAEKFAERLRSKLESWNARMTELRRRGRTAAVWGGGSKGVTFLNMTEAGSSVEVLVDINPRKHGLFVPVTGQEVVPPERLAASPPDTVVVMNPLYEEEIRERLRTLGVRAEVLVA